MTGRPADLLDLDPAGPGVRRGRVRAALGTRGFGGHLLAHVVRASSRAAGAGRPVSSLHAHFLGAAHADRPIEYTVGTLKRGRAFEVHQVLAGQGDRTIMAGTVTHHAPEAGADYQVRMPSVPAADRLQTVDYRPPGTHAAVREPFELRYVDDRFRDGDGPDPNPSLATWVRFRGDLPSASAADHAALLAYAVDFLVTRVAHMPVRTGAEMIGVSLDHAMWFHRPFRVDDWLLVSCRASSFAGARSLSRAEIFDPAGTLVATAVQEALLRERPA